jgi:rubredoxin
MNYVCELCGYVYKPRKGDVDNGIEPGTDYEDLPADWTCPLCGASKEDFEPDNEGKSIYDTTEEF